MLASKIAARRTTGRMPCLFNIVGISGHIKVYSDIGMTFIFSGSESIGYLPVMPGRVLGLLSLH
jgi:hypothetical protein